MNIQLKKENKFDFYNLEVGTMFIWHTEDSEGNMIGMKIADIDGLNRKVLELSEYDCSNGIYYDWDDRYHIDKIIDCDLIEK